MILDDAFGVVAGLGDDAQTATTWMRPYRETAEMAATHRADADEAGAMRSDGGARSSASGAGGQRQSCDGGRLEKRRRRAYES
jgi:hypothetical protein